MLTYDLFYKATQGNEIAIELVEEDLGKSLSMMNEAEKHQLTLDLLQKKAEYGSAKAQHDVSLTLRYLYHDAAGAFYWMKRSAEGGYPKAMASLGADYYEGIPGVVDKDTAQAQSWWDKEQKAEAAITNATNKIESDAYIALDAIEAEPDDFFWNRQIQSKAHIDYSTLPDGEKKYLKYAAYKSAALGANNAETKYRLYHLMLNEMLPIALQSSDPTLVYETEQEAIDWLIRAAEDGHKRAMLTLCATYSAGGYQYPPADPDRKAYWLDATVYHENFCRAVGAQLGEQCLDDARRGNEACQSQVSQLFGKSYGDIIESEYLLMYCGSAWSDAQRGDAEAMSLVGSSLCHNYQPEDGLFWLQKAVDGGSDSAASHLWYFYKYGIPGVLERDPEKAEYYWQLKTSLEQAASPSSAATPAAATSTIASAPAAATEAAKPAPAKKKGLFGALFGKK